MKKKIIFTVSTISMILLVLVFAILLFPTTFFGEYTDQKLIITITPENNTRYGIYLPMIHSFDEKAPIYSNEELSGDLSHSFIESEKGMTHYIEGLGSGSLIFTFRDRYCFGERTSDDGRHLRAEDYLRYDFTPSDDGFMWCKGLNETFENNTIIFEMKMKAKSDFCAGQTLISGTIYSDDIWRICFFAESYVCE